MVKIIWRFSVKPDHVQDFLRAYGPSGDWARLFATSSAYGGTELLQEAGEAAVYLTIDRWMKAEDFDDFKQRFKSEYEAIDLRCLSFTSGEELMGVFEVVE